jgi:hypothetical protein
MDRFPRKRFFSLFSIILTACLAFTVILMAAFALDTPEHDCSGEDCPICLLIENAQNLLKIFVLAHSAAFLAWFGQYAGTVLRTADPYPFARKTLVSLKVQHNS